MTTRTFEQVLRTFPKIGSDEVGKGDFFGPLVVAAVFLEKPEILEGLHVLDSKKLSTRAVQRLAPQLKKRLPHAVVRIGPAKYNELYGKLRNINIVLGWAHARAIKNLQELQPLPPLILIDRFGPETRVRANFHDPAVQQRLTFFSGAERDPAVACASVIARAAFLEEMERLSAEADQKLPLGAGLPTIAAARQLARRLGKPALSRFVKTHFKNFAALTDG